MYTLRIIEETRENEKAPFEAVVSNHELADSYAKFGPDTRRFRERVDSNLHERITMLIIGGNGKEFFLQRNHKNTEYHYFVMTDSGKTFERL